jgi:hypothetical protein
VRKSFLLLRYGGFSTRRYQAMHTYGVRRSYSKRAFGEAECFFSRKSEKRLFLGIDFFGEMCYFIYNPIGRLD